MFDLLVENFLPALFGNSEARKLLQTLLVVQKELDEAEQHTTSVEAWLAELHERLQVFSTQQNEQSLVEENQQLKNTAEELRQEIDASRRKIVQLEEEFKTELEKNRAELENVRFKNDPSLRIFGFSINNLRELNFNLECGTIWYIIGMNTHASIT